MFLFERIRILDSFKNLLFVTNNLIFFFSRKVIELPDTLCIHLKRFRHDFAFSSKISTKVVFPLQRLDMAPWLHKDCVSNQVRRHICDDIGIQCCGSTTLPKFCRLTNRKVLVLSFVNRKKLAFCYTKFQ